MAKINPFALNRPEDRFETKTFTDDLNPGVELTLALRGSPEAPFISALNEKAQKYIRDYIDGRNGGPPGVLPLVKGRPICPTAEVCRAAAYIEGMQSDQDDAERYTFVELLALSVTMPSAFMEAFVWASELAEPAAMPSQEADGNP